MIIIIIMESFSDQCQLMVFHWGLSDSKCPQVSWTRLSILAVLGSAVVWIVSTRPPTSKSSRPFYNPLVIVPNAPITICTIVIFMFHSIFNSLTRSRYLSFFWYYYYYLLIRDFHISVIWWSFTGDWVTARLLKSPWLFSVFWPSSIMLLFVWSLLGRQLPVPPGPLISFSYRAKSTNHNWYNCHFHVQ